MKTFITKNHLFVLCLLSMGLFANAQNGLENIIVERYYVSNADDEAGSVGILPVGSVTYRIFADMLPGYKFQMAYGSPATGIYTAHPLSIQTSTSFFNNEDRGATTPTYTKTQAKSNTVMLDSWLSVGAACSGNFGVLKSEDNGVATVINSDAVLQNADPSAGIPLTTEDGLITGTTQSVTFVGLNTELSVFDATSQAGNSFMITNGAWASLNGSTGHDANTNRVLIGQITTDGLFTFELNVQIGTPTGDVEKYVASNPAGAEIMLPSLIYNSVINEIKEVKNNQAENSNSFSKIYPNPMHDNFTIQLSEISSNSICKYSVRDIMGKVLCAKEFQNTSGNINENVDMSSFANGIYFVKVTANGMSTVHKLIKK